MPMPGMRAQVLDSWHRSAAAGVRVDARDAPITLADDELRDYRAAHPLARIFPVLDDVLGQAAVDCDALMAVSDDQGQLLWVCGSNGTLRRAHQIGFVEGSNWDERMAGTNAPGLALALDAPAEVIGAEHFRQAVQAWNCVASPIHDPATGALLGVLDITGGEQIVGPQTVAMVRAAARMAEAELAREWATHPVPTATLRGLSLRLELLGRHEGLVTVQDAGRPVTTRRLSPRHSEILLLLAAHPGLSGDELAALLYEGDPPVATLRAELNRVRHLLGDDLVRSRPYRLAVEVSGDWRAVEARLVAGDVDGALRHYRGPVLPRSTAPGVMVLRDALTHDLRQAVLRSGNPNLMSTWTRSRWGTDDLEMWQAQERTLTADSPLLTLTQGQVARLHREYGVPAQRGPHRP